MKKQKIEFLGIIKKLPQYVLVGLLGGLLGTLFHMSLEQVTVSRQNNLFIILFLPLGGLVIAGIYNACRSYGNIDINRVFASARGNGDVPLVMIPLIFVSTLITHLLGGSAGREGAALQLGGSLGYNLARLFKQDEKIRKNLVASGMSALFAALFGTPLTAAVFSLEVTGAKFNLHGLAAAVVSSVTAFLTAGFLGVKSVRFCVPKGIEYNIDVVVRIVVLAVLCAYVCVVFAIILNFMKSFMKKQIKNSYVRAFAGGVAVVLLTIAFNTTDYNGAGMDIISNALKGEAYGLAFLVKILFTAITISSGFKGGEIVPTFFVGATFGCFAGTFLGIDPAVCAALGFVALFSGMTKCPIAAFLLAIEVFSGEYIPLFFIMVLIAHKLSGSFGLYNNTKAICIERRK